MRLLTQKAEVRYSVIIFSVLFFLIALLLISYWLDVLPGEKWGAIISGLLTGLIVFAFQIWLSWQEILKLDAYDALKIIKILPRRSDREYYGKLLATAKEQILLQGVTVQRFLEDFASKEDRQEDAKVLLAALGKNVKVRILAASPDYLVDKRNKDKAEQAQIRMKELASQFRNFEYAYFSHPPSHVILTVDGENGESIVGPVFPKVSSKLTPAIHIRNSSEYVKHYLEYFEKEWEEWGPQRKA